MVAARRDFDFRGDVTPDPRCRRIRCFEGTSHWWRAVDAQGRGPFHCADPENFRNQKLGSVHEWNLAYAPSYSWKTDGHGFARGWRAIDQHLPGYARSTCLFSDYRPGFARAGARGNRCRDRRWLRSDQIKYCPDARPKRGSIDPADRIRRVA